MCPSGLGSALVPCPRAAGPCHGGCCDLPLHQPAAARSMHCEHSVTMHPGAGGAAGGGGGGGGRVVGVLCCCESPEAATG